MRSRINLLTVLLCFFLSGAAGLIYQVAWTKALGLVFGHTVYAIATVLAVFMGGLAAGSAWLGRWGGRQKSPVAIYGWIELLIAASGALSLLGLSGVRAVYLATYHFASGWLPILVLVRVITSALVLFVPTFLMGGTLPILTRGLTRSSAELGTRLSRLYWINTAGAVAGALAGGFLLLPAIGLRWTVATAVALNAIAGALALLIAASVEAPAEVNEGSEASAAAAHTPIYLIITFALVGATAMAYEIAWSRLLATTLGSSTYAFTIMLATFLGGIVIGGFVFERWARRGRETSVGSFATTQTLTGLGGLAFLIIFQWLPALPLALIRATHMTFGGLVLAQFLTCGLAMLPAAIIFGFNFPLVTLLISGKAEGPAQAALVGRACASNTLGAILGALAAGFWLLPWLGSFRLVAMTVTANLAVAFFLQMKRAPRRRIEVLGNASLAGVVFVVGCFGLLYDPQMANFNAVNHPEQFPPQLRLRELVHQSELLFVEDGLNASIEVIRGGSQLSLRTNGKTDGSTLDRTTQLMLGHLGTAFHPRPKKVLIIGFGTGMTVSAVARYPDVEQIDCIEIEPAVMHAYPHLAVLNRGVLGDRRVHVILDDARNFLFATQNRYDLIISEPSNPWVAGVATLFTQEFYRQVRARLQPGGMFVQWVQAYTIFPQDLKMIFGTLTPEFPRVSLWAGGPADYILLAQSEAGLLTLDRLRQSLQVPAVREDFQQLGIYSPEGLIAYHRLDDADLRALLKDALRNTDDHTRLEYRAPQALLSVSALGENQLMMARQHSTLLPRSVAIEDQRHALVAAAQTAMAEEDYQRAGTFLAALPQDPSTAEAELIRAQWLAASGKLDEARTACERARTLDPSSTSILFELANIAGLQKDYGSAEKFLEQILQQQPGSLPVFQSFAMLELQQGNVAKAIEWQIKRVRGDPAPQARDLNVLASLFVKLGDYGKAESIYAISLSQDPHDFGAHFRLGEIYLQQGRWDEARKQLEFVVRWFPLERPEPYIDLAQAYSSLGQSSDAKSIVDKGRRFFPNDTVLLRAASD